MYLTKILLYVASFTFFFSYAAFSNEPPATSIFVLSSGSVDSQWTKSVSHGITDRFNQANHSFIYYIDHLDVGRFNEEKQHDVMLQYLKEKFRNRTPDIFISAGPFASEFSLLYPDLFPTSKRILIQPRNRVFSQDTDVVTINTKIDYSTMVKKALSLSDPETVFIIGDSRKPNGPHSPNKISRELKKENITYTSLMDKDLPSLIHKVSEIPSNSTIFYTPIYREYEGKGLAPVLVLKKLHEVAKAPIFSTSVVEIGYGSVGGYLHSSRELGLMAGEAALKIIDNEPIEFTQDGYELIYDWNEVIRWGYQKKISPDAEIRFRTPSIWNQHRNEAIIFSLFLIVLVALVLVLIVYNRKLKKNQKCTRKRKSTIRRKSRKTY